MGFKQTEMWNHNRLQPAKGTWRHKLKFVCEQDLGSSWCCQSERRVFMQCAMVITAMEGCNS
jgi:hypothetical protein